MADVVQFFLQMAPEEGGKAKPYLLTFGLARGDVALVAEDAGPILEAIKNSGDFADDTQAAELALADAIVANGHLDAEVQHVMAPLVVFLATNSPDKLAIIAAGAKKVGFLLTPGKKAPQLTFQFVNA